MAPFFERLNPAVELLCLAKVAHHLGFQCDMTGRKHVHAGKQPTLGVLELIVFAQGMTANCWSAICRWKRSRH
jgi:hypothetical protein